MKIRYAHEHMACQHFVTPENAHFIVRRFKKGEYMRHNPAKCVIVFLMKGKLSLMGDNCRHYVTENTPVMWLTYRDCEICAQAEEDGWLVVCRLTSQMNLCNRFTLQNLAEDIDFKSIVPSFYTLPVHPRIIRFLSLLTACLDEGIGCMHYYQLKHEELMIYLRVYYTKEELANLFYPLLGGNTSFKEFVLDHYRQVRDIKELAQMANLSISTFNRRFRESFHISPQKWLINRRSENILRDIFLKDLSFAEIADKYGLSSTAYLNTFCKKHYGKTPNTLREEGFRAYSPPNGEQQL